MVVIGGSLLWFGWFGFNAGSALTAGGLASNAFVTTMMAGAVALLVAWPKAAVRADEKVQVDAKFTDETVRIGEQTVLEVDLSIPDNFHLYSMTKIPDGPLPLKINALETQFEGLDETSLKSKTAEFRETFANPYVASSRGFIDEVIRPRQTRRKIISALDGCASKRASNPPKKHGNIPL